VGYDSNLGPKWIIVDWWHTVKVLKAHYRQWHILCIGGKCVHELGRVGLKGFFNPTHYGGLKKIQPNPTHHKGTTQPNPTHIDRVGSGWTHRLDSYLFIYLLLLLL